jgi:DNA-binding NtrC family response regulator
MEALEREIIVTALAQARGKRRDAAALLGIDPKNLAYYLKKHKLSDEEGEVAEA